MPDLNGASTNDSENELDESWEGLDPIQDPVQAPILEDPNTVGDKKPYRKKTYLAGLFATVLCLLTGTYLILQHEPIQTAVKKPQVYRCVISKASPLLFDAFVIPLRKNPSFTYISIDMVFNIQEGMLRKEIIEKKVELRGIIYDILNKEINHTERIPSLDALKPFVLEGVNRVLSAGKIDGVYVSQYLAV